MKKILIAATLIFGVFGVVSAQDTTSFTKEEIATLKSLDTDSSRSVMSDSERAAKIDSIVAKALKNEKVVNAVAKATQNQEVREFVAYNLNSPQVRKNLKGTQISKEIYNEKGEVKVNGSNNPKSWITATIVIAAIIIVVLGCIAGILSYVLYSISVGV